MTLKRNRENIMMHIAQKTARLMKAASVCTLLLIAAMMTSTARAGLSDCTVQSAQLLGPEHDNIIAVAPGTFQNKDFIGAHRYFQITYRCKVDNALSQWGIRIHHSPTTTHSGLDNIIWAGGNSYTAYTTSHLVEYGIGFVAYIYPTNHWPEGILHFDNIQQSAPLLYHHITNIDNNNYADFSITTLFRFIKVNNNFDALLDTTTTTPYPNPIPMATISIGDNEGYISPQATVTAYMPTLTIQRRACTPFVDTIILPSVDASQLPFVGSTGGTTDFRFTVRCPHNAARFGYYVESAHGYEDEAQGIIKIDPVSAAQGIGLQITTRHSPDPVTLGTNTLAPNYQPIKFGPTNRYGDASYVMINATGDPLTDDSDYTFPHLDSPPLKVAVYRTGNIVPGTYTAAIKVYIVYR